MKKVDVKIGLRCNNNCIFCVQANNKPIKNRNLKDIKKDLSDSRIRCQGVVFTGGEVTIRGDFFELVSFAKSLKYQTIQIQSNGRRFSSLSFAKKAIKAGATEFAISLHGFSANQHDSLTNAAGSFEQTCKGIQNLKKLKALVLTNTVINKNNYRSLPKIAKLLVKLDVDQFQLAFIHPMGNAWKNYHRMVPKISKVMPYVKKGLDVGIKAKKQAVTEAIPYCLMKGYEKHIAEKFIPETEVRGMSWQNTDNFTQIRQIFGKAKFNQCQECLFNIICEGPWKEYPDKYGNSEFIPIK